MSSSVPTNTTAGHCPQCGAALRTDASFCTACGAAVGGAAPATPSRPARPAPRSKRSPWLAVVALLAILAVAAIGWALFNDAQQPASVAIPTVAAAQNVPYPNVARVSPEQAHISAMSDQALIVDVRGQEYYDAGHARGAISIPLEQLPARLAELPKDQAILFYCT